MHHFMQLNSKLFSSVYFFGSVVFFLQPQIWPQFHLKKNLIVCTKPWRQTGLCPVLYYIFLYHTSDNLDIMFHPSQQMLQGETECWTIGKEINPESTVYHLDKHGNIYCMLFAFPLQLARYGRDTTGAGCMLSALESYMQLYAYHTSADAICYYLVAKEYQKATLFLPCFHLKQFRSS